MVEGLFTSIGASCGYLSHAGSCFVRAFQEPHIKQNIVFDDLRLVIGHVLQLVWRRHIPKRPHSGSSRFAVLIDDDSPAIIKVYTGHSDVEEVAIGGSSHGDEKRLGADCGSVVKSKGDSLGVFCLSFRLGDGAAKICCPALGRDLSETL